MAHWATSSRSSRRARPWLRRRRRPTARFERTPPKSKMRRQAPWPRSDGDYAYREPFNDALPVWNEPLDARIVALKLSRPRLETGRRRNDFHRNEAQGGPTPWTIRTIPRPASRRRHRTSAPWPRRGSAIMPALAATGRRL
jgi:hypothetical protein